MLLCTGQASLNKELLHPGTKKSFLDSNHSATPSLPLGSAPFDRNTKRAPEKLTDNELNEKIARKYGIVRSTADQMVKQADAVNRSFLGSIAGNNSGMLIGLVAAALFVIFYASQ